MGALHRTAKPTTQFDSSKLAALRKQAAQETDYDEPTIRMAAGTTPPADVIREAADADPDVAVRAHRNTAYDPLTTTLLAEVTRTKTGEHDHDDGGELASPRLVRRKP